MTTKIDASTSGVGGLITTADNSGVLELQTGGVTGLLVDTNRRLLNVAIGVQSDIGAANAKLVLAATSAGAPSPSGTTDANVNYRFAHQSVTLDSGVYAVGSVWWQARSLSNYTINYDINFQPNGGNTLHIGAGGGLGYGTGAGGTVTQLTSKSTAVTLNKPVGRITLSNAALGASTSTAFVVNNSLVAATDTIILSIQDSISSNLAYQATISGVGAGSFTVAIRNVSAGSLSDAITINFAVIKGATS